MSSETARAVWLSFVVFSHSLVEVSVMCCSSGQSEVEEAEGGARETQNELEVGSTARSRGFPGSGIVVWWVKAWSDAVGEEKRRRAGILFFGGRVGAGG